MFKEKIDVKSIAASVPLLVEIDKQDSEFYQLIKDKKLEPKVLRDLEKIEVLFNNNLKKILKLVNSSSFEKEEINLINARVILDSHNNIANKFGFDTMEVPKTFGPWNEEIFQKAMVFIKESLEN